MSINLKDNIKNNIKKENEISISNTDIKEEKTVVFEIGKKKDDKSEKKSFPLYVDAKKQKELDKVAKKTGYSRNELINMMIDFCLENIKYTD